MRMHGFLIKFHSDILAGVLLTIFVGTNACGVANIFFFIMILMMTIMIIVNSRHPNQKSYKLYNDYRVAGMS